MGTQKNHLNEMVLLSTLNIMFKLVGKKILTLLRSKIVLISSTELAHIYAPINAHQVIFVLLNALPTSPMKQFHY